MNYVIMWQYFKPTYYLVFFICEKCVARNYKGILSKGSNVFNYTDIDNYLQYFFLNIISNAIVDL